MTWIAKPKLEARRVRECGTVAGSAPVALRGETSSQPTKSGRWRARRATVTLRDELATYEE